MKLKEIDLIPTKIFLYHTISTLKFNFFKLWKIELINKSNLMVLKMMLWLPAKQDAPYLKLSHHISKKNESNIFIYAKI